MLLNRGTKKPMTAGAVIGFFNILFFSRLPGGYSGSTGGVP